VRGSYHTWMPTGKSWRFHHWIWTGNAYVDEYREFTTNELQWSPKQWLAYTYDPLDRLTGVAPVSGWQGYTGAYTYSAIGNLTGKTEDGSAWAYSYPGSGAGSIRPHAVITVASVSSYGYDANGNMVTRTIGNDTYLLSYDVENRLKEVKKSGVVTATFGYDGDGKMVTATVGLTTTYYVGNYFERVNGITNTYYYHAGKRVAMRTGNTLYWLLTDRLGSTSMVVAATSALTGELRYKAYGEGRYAWGITTTTKYHFTGQREESVIGLYFYNARWYDAALGRFVQPDSVVPQPGNPQAVNRYSYALNNPLRYSDPTGRAICEDEQCRQLTRIPPEIGPALPSVVWLTYLHMIGEAGGATVALLTTLNTQCLSCDAPLGYKMAAAAADLGARASAMAVFAWKVRQGGEWDLKPKIEQQGRQHGSDEHTIHWNQIEPDGPEYYYDIWANIDFGYLGEASGFSANILLEGAGLEQIGSSIGYALAYRDPARLPKRAPGVEGLRAWDPPPDQKGIQIGINLWNTYALSVRPEDIFGAIKQTQGLESYPR